MTTARHSSLPGMAALLGNTLCWGAVPVMLRGLTNSVDAWTANGFRYPLAAVLYWPVLLLAIRAGRLDRSMAGRCVVPALLALGGQVFWALSPYYLPASAIGFFVRASLVWAVIGAMLLFADERRLLTVGRFYLGLAITVVGFLVLSISKMRFDAEVSAVGIAIILACGFFFGLYGVSVRYYLRGISPMVAFGVVCQIVSLGTLAGMIAVGDYADLLSLSCLDWIVMASSSVMGIALGHALMYFAVKRLGAAITAGSLTMTPFVTAALAWFFLGETMSLAGWLGGIAMVAGALILLLTENTVVPHPDDL